jgi:hypothetical protein
MSVRSAVRISLPRSGLSICRTLVFGMCGPARLADIDLRTRSICLGVIWRTHSAMSESNDSRIESEECVRKANSCDDSQDRRAWLVLAESWLLLGKIHEIVENRHSIEGNKGKPALVQANTAQYRGAA